MVQTKVSGITNGTDHHALVFRLMDDLVDHGWGEMTFRVSKVKNEPKVKVEILCGRSYVMFIRKDIVLGDEIV